MSKRKPFRYSPRILRSLQATYYRATAYDVESGLSWYQVAHDTASRIGRDNSVTVEQVCGVIAAISPGLEWNLNIEQAEEFIASYVAGNRGKWLPTIGVYGTRNRVKALSILKGKDALDVLGGPKTRAFYTNLLRPTDTENVTIDRHAKCCAHGVKSPENAVVKRSEYDYLARHYRHVAGKLNLIPCQFQAIAWVTWKRIGANPGQSDMFETGWNTSDTNEIPF